MHSWLKGGLVDNVGRFFVSFQQTLTLQPEGELATHSFPDLFHERQCPLMGCPMPCRTV